MKIPENDWYGLPKFMTASRAEFWTYDFIRVICGRHFFPMPSLHMEYYRTPWLVVKWVSIVYCFEVFTQYNEVQLWILEFWCIHSKYGKAKVHERSKTGQLQLIQSLVNARTASFDTTRQENGLAKAHTNNTSYKRRKDYQQMHKIRKTASYQSSLEPSRTIWDTKP